MIPTATSLSENTEALMHNGSKVSWTRVETASSVVLFVDYFQTRRPFVEAAKARFLERWRAGRRRVA
jgi:hypothetical protein